jgi:hypothetical protein
MAGTTKVEANRQCGIDARYGAASIRCTQASRPVTSPTRSNFGEVLDIPGGGGLSDSGSLAVLLDFPRDF